MSLRKMNLALGSAHRNFDLASRIEGDVRSIGQTHLPNFTTPGEKRQICRDHFAASPRRDAKRQGANS